MEENLNIDKKSLKFLIGIQKEVISLGLLAQQQFYTAMEINKHKVRRILRQLVNKGQLKSEGIKKWTKYSIEQNLQENQ